MSRSTRSFCLHTCSERYLLWRHCFAYCAWTLCMGKTKYKQKFVIRMTLSSDWEPQSKGESKIRLCGKASGVCLCWQPLPQRAEKWLPVLAESGLEIRKCSKRRQRYGLYACTLLQPRAVLCNLVLVIGLATVTEGHKNYEYKGTLRDFISSWNEDRSHFSISPYLAWSSDLSFFLCTWLWEAAW